MHRFVAHALLLGILATGLTPLGSLNSAVVAQLEEVVVTARKREENIQETPLAVTAMSGEALRDQGIENVGDLSKSVPSLQITKGQSNQIYIRGIGERTGFVRVDPTVGVYLDDLFLPRADGQLLDTVDIESLQVLRGPQGTLFGKNTTGGALVLSLAKPDFEGTYGYVEGTVGNYRTFAGRATINVPVNDTFSTRFSLNASDAEGFSEDAFAGDTANTNGFAALAQTRWDINEAMSLDTLLSYGEQEERLQQTTCNINNDDALFVNGLALVFPNPDGSAEDPTSDFGYRSNCENNSRDAQGDLNTNKGPNPLLTQDFKALLFGATLNWELSEDYSAKIVFGARQAREGVIQSSDNDGGIINISEAINGEPSDRESMSIEAQLNGSLFESRLNFVAGVFAAMEDNNETFTLVSNFVGIDATSLGQLAAAQSSGVGDVTRPAAPTNAVVGALTGSPILRSRFTLDNTTLAAFIQSSYDITDNLQLTLGIRYTEERRESTLTNARADTDDIIARMTAAGFTLSSPDPLLFNAGPWVEGPNGLGPVARAYDVFADRNGDGFPDYVIDEDNPDFFEAEDTFSSTTPMISLGYTFDESLLEGTFLDILTTYVTLSEGFKSGFFEPRGVDGLARIEPEEVTNTEIGFKMDMFDRTLRLNIAAYKTDYTNIQLITVSQDSGQNLIVVFTNAGEAVIEGAEAELQWLPFEGALISLNYSNNNYYYTEFKDTNLADLAIRNTVTEVDRSGEPFPAAPTESASLGLQVSIPVDEEQNLIFTPRLDLSWKSEVFYGLDAESASAYRRDEALAGADEYFLLDARFTLSPPDGNWRATAYMKNVFDERYIIGTASVADSLGTYNQIYGEPRTFGITVTRDFSF